MMIGREHRRILVATAGSLALLVLPASASAQRQFGPPDIPDSAVTVTAERVYKLERDVKASRNDPVKWHELGMLAWGLEPVVVAGGLPLEKPMRLARVADTALQTAAMIDARNVKYQLYAANRLQASNVGIVRVGSKKYFKRAIEAARLLQDNALIAASALEYGRTVWWQFEAMEHRHLYVGAVTPRSLSDAMQPLARGAASLEALIQESLAQDYARLVGADPVTGEALDPLQLTRGQIDNIMMNSEADDAVMAKLPQHTFKSVWELLKAHAQPLPPDLGGWTDYEEASKLYHEAYRAEPMFPGAFRAVALTYVVKNLWGNLERFAARHVAAFPRDSMAWMALGLARHRMGNVPGARRAFDTSLVLLGDAERKRLDNWRRIIPPGRDYLKLPSGKDIDEELYWKVANPLWADSVHDARLEFLSRVTYAELRWTVEEFALPGADTDRGMTYVRYGPPDKIYGFGTSLSDAATDIVQYWLYDNGLMFAFTGKPTFGTMRIPSEDVAMTGELNRLFPVRWENVRAPVTDSLTVFLSRFRAGPDSLDVAIAVNYQSPDSIARTMSIAAPVQRHLWVKSAGAGSERHLSDTLKSGGPFLWATRVVPGTMVYRVEAFAETATRAQRATGVLGANTPEFPLSGAGLSDLLLARDLRDSSARRWSDAGAVPYVGAVRRGDALTVLWENYEFAVREGRADYEVTLTLKAERGRGARIRAEILGVLASLVRTDIAPDQVTMTFSRSVPHAAAFADWVSLRVPEAPEGRYSVTLTINDRVSGKTLTRASNVAISK